MFGRNAPVARARDEAEKPFWISFSDLMTAMMILFLVIMVVSLTKVTSLIEDAKRMEKVDEQAKKESARLADIKNLCEELSRDASLINSSIFVDCKNNRINFGEAGKFPSNSYSLDEAGRHALRDVVPLILRAADSETGKKYLKQVLVEGYADTDGSYLYNLHLSMQRSERVMCELLDGRSPIQEMLTGDEKHKIRTLFLAGGDSFNNAKEDKDSSRRVELRMQFYGLNEPAKEALSRDSAADIGERCRLDKFP